MLINLNETYDLLNETRVLSTRDTVNTQNRFVNRPQGILVQDSYNNPFFPIRPQPKIDTSKLDTNEIYRRYRELYAEVKGSFLPWHYCIEMVDNTYYVMNTRPIDLRFPINTKEATEYKKENEWVEWNSETKQFFKEEIFDIRDAIHICLIGSSELDVYTINMYSMIGRICMTPLLRQFKLPGGLYQRVFPLNLGRKFKFLNISKFIK